jgi:addiction module RelE/StbE family toxin
MHIGYHRKFKKALRKQPTKIQDKFFHILEIFRDDQFHFSLNNHALRGDFLGVRSFDITGDVRVHYEASSIGIVLIDIGTHAQLYR